MLIIDRIENLFAVCERDGQEFVHIPLADIWGQPREGSVLQEDGAHYRVDPEATATRVTAVRTKRKRLFEKTRQSE